MIGIDIGSGLPSTIQPRKVTYSTSLRAKHLVKVISSMLINLPEPQFLDQKKKKEECVKSYINKRYHDDYDNFYSHV